MTTNIISKTPEEIKNEWRTPPEIFRWASSIIGGFDFDTACNFDNALAHPIYAGNSPLNIDDDDDGGDALAFDWTGKCWCNPPYDDVDTWADYATDQCNAITALLIPSPNGESRYKRLCEKSHEIQIVGRLAFLTPEGKPVRGNTRGSSLFIINGYAQGSRSIVMRDDIYSEFGK